MCVCVCLWWGGGGVGGGVCPPNNPYPNLPTKGFPEFFFLADKTSAPKCSVAVRLSLSRILKYVYEWSVTMVTRYDVISSRWSSHF